MIWKVTYDFRLYLLFNSISVKWEAGKGDNEQLYTMETRLGLKSFQPSAGNEPG